MGFPDERDRQIIRQAARVQDLATNICDWLTEFNGNRRKVDLLPIPEGDEFEILQLRRLASSLYTSSKVPVAAAVYGPSQVGKSLFMGQVLRAQSDSFSPLGRDEAHGEPAYYKELSFNNDLNPQSGSNEATALVTRFTTKDRISESVSPEYPVMVKALTRVEWIRVLARGFQVECRGQDFPWDESHLDKMLEDASRQFPGASVDRRWRMDILDAYSYMRTVDRRGFPTKEAILNALLSRYQMSDEGYVHACGQIFWGGWPTLNGLFIRINKFLEKLSKSPEPAILVHWAGVRFLLDSQRAKVHERKTSKCFTRVDWADFHLRQRKDWFVLEYTPGSGDGDEDLETIQAAMLELVLPILPHRLNDDWRKVIEQMDFLDIPGMRAGRQGAEQGKRTEADKLEEQMEIVKRGKVAYLFERFTDELQIQTLILLSRGGNLEVTSQMKYHIDKWGRARYGDKYWPSKVHDDLPALFIGMTGIDEEFRNRQEYADKGLYQQRLGQLVDTLGPVMTDFGGRGKAFTNTYPIRYPGTWDTNEEQRQADDPEKWVRAKRAFLESDRVQDFTSNPEQRWNAAMTDGDGGLSLISAGIRAVTTATDKQNQLEKEINQVLDRILLLAQDWVVDPDANVDREKRVRAAERVVNWLTDDPEAAYARVYALQEALSIPEGENWQLADCADLGKRHGDPLPKSLRSFLHEWATKQVPKRWEQYTKQNDEGAPWLDGNDLNTFVRYLRDYLQSQHCIDSLIDELNPVVNLKTRDEAARRYARRKYVKMIMDDFIMNPGPTQAAIAPPQKEADDDDKKEQHEKPLEYYGNYGLTASFVKRWCERLPEALALGAGDHIQIPPGNAELIEILEPFESIIAQMKKETN
ncbi:MAG: virulence factor SrfC family protein [Planctomycetia bacterium]|nr:virulence factor SrfC family protein [Planctomycetia bacterium]